MASGLQCLSNTEPFVKFFISDVYEHYVNDKNPLGTRGRLALAFGDLLKELWVEQKSAVAPWDIKTVIAKRAVQFQGFSQHDSQEMLSFLLQTLHEDLNEVTRKPYIEQKDSNGRPDSEVAAEYWDNFQKRDKSILVDLFYGQLKSRVECQRCKHFSISFDPFSMLSVPIPSKLSSKLYFKYLSLNIAEKPKVFMIPVTEYISN
jgi:ubiquitin C-terminal hydrolase